MLMTRAKPILASAAMALSLTACQWMMGEPAQQEQAFTPRAAGPSAQPGVAQQPQYQQQQPQAQYQQPQFRQPQAQFRQQQPQFRQQARQTQSVDPQFVQQVQRNLGEQGYHPGPIDGVWGNRTRAAVENFQRDKGIRQSGQLDRQTLAALGLDEAQIGMQPQQQRQPREQQMGQQQMGQQQMGARPSQSMSPNVVRNLQQELSDRGYRVGTVDGIWGPQTQQALSNFQRDRNLQATGQIDRQTMAALGLDAQVGERPEFQQQQQQQPDIGPN